MYDRMSKLSLIFVALLGCDWRPEEQLVAAPQHVDRAVETITEVFEAAHGTLPPLTNDVFWVDAPCMRHDDKCWTGLYFEDGRDIWLGTFSSVSMSSLSHEMVHYWLDVTLDDVDGNHSRVDWWSLVEVADDRVWFWEKCYVVTSWREGMPDECLNELGI